MTGVDESKAGDAEQATRPKRYASQAKHGQSRRHGGSDALLILDLDVVSVHEEMRLVEVVDNDLLVGVEVLDELLHGHVAVVCGVWDKCIYMGKERDVVSVGHTRQTHARTHAPGDEDALARKHGGMHVLLVVVVGSTGCCVGACGA